MPDPNLSKTGWGVPVLEVGFWTGNFRAVMEFLYACFLLLFTYRFFKEMMAAREVR